MNVDTFVWLFNAPLRSIHMKITQMAKCLVFSVDVPFFGVSACRETLFENQKNDCFSHYTFCFKMQLGRASTHAVVSSSLWKCMEGRIPCFGRLLLVSSIIMFKYKLHLSCCWQWWNLLYVSTTVISLNGDLGSIFWFTFQKKIKKCYSSEVTGHIYLCFLPPAFKWRLEKNHFH